MFHSRAEKEVINKGASEADEPSKKLTTKFKCLQSACEDLLTEVHLYFYTFVLPLFTNYNLFLQRGDPLAHKVYPMTKELHRKTAIRFMKPDAFQVNDVTVDLIDDLENYLPLEEIFVSFTTKNLLKKLFSDGEIYKLQYNVLEAARTFYKESLKYVIKKMDMTDAFWNHPVWVDFFSRETAKWNDIKYFISRHEGILQFDHQEIDMLYEEFVDYKTLSINELSEDALADAVIQGNKNSDEYQIGIM